MWKSRLTCVAGEVWDQRDALAEWANRLRFEETRIPQPREMAQIGNFCNVDKLYVSLCPCEATIITYNDSTTKLALYGHVANLFPLRVSYLPP